MNPRPLPPETPWTTGRCSVPDQPLRICMPVVVEHYEVSTSHTFARVRHSIERSIELNRRVTNRRRLPLPIRIPTAKIRNLQLAFALRFDLVEQLDLVRRRTVCEYKNFHVAFACLNFMNKCERPTHASTT